MKAEEPAAEEPAFDWDAHYRTGGGGYTIKEEDYDVFYGSTATARPEKTPPSAVHRRLRPPPFLVFLFRFLFHIVKIPSLELKKTRRFY